MSGLEITVEQAIGFCGNILAESWADPHAGNIAEKTGKASYSKANSAADYGEGIVQWSFSGTKQTIKKLMGKYSDIHTWSLADQCEAIVRQLHSGGYWDKFMAKLKTMANIAEATVFVYNAYESGTHINRTLAQTLKTDSKANNRSIDIWVGPKITDFVHKTYSTTGEANVYCRVSYANMVATYMSAQKDWQSIAINAGTLSENMALGTGGISGDTLNAAAYTMGVLEAMSSSRYPVHSEYLTFSEEYTDLFKQTNSSDNTLKVSQFTETGNTQIQKKIHTGRIYSVNDATIVLDELSLPLNYQEDEFTSSNNQKLSATDRYNKTKSYDKLVASSFNNGKSGKNTNNTGENNDNKTENENGTKT